jgi:hypothetical protein
VLPGLGAARGSRRAPLVHVRLNLKRGQSPEGDARGQFCVCPPARSERAFAHREFVRKAKGSTKLDRRRSVRRWQGAALLARSGQAAESYFKLSKNKC